MFTKRQSDDAWIKFILQTQLVTVEKLHNLKGTANQVDLTDLLCRHADSFDSVAWVNAALQRDRFHFFPSRETVDPNELSAFCEQFPHLFNRFLHEGVLPVGYAHQILYLGLIRYDDDFVELKALLQELPKELMICLCPLGPKEFVRIRGQLQNRGQF